MSISPRKSKRKGELLSALALSKLLGRDRASIIKWADEGMPYQSRPDANNAGEWSFYTAEVVDWIEERAVQKTKAQYTPPDEDFDNEDMLRNPKTEADAKLADAISTARKKYWDGIRARDAAEKERGNLVSRWVVEAVVQAKIIELKGKLYNLTPKVSLDFDDPDEKIRVVNSLDKRLREELDSLSFGAKDMREIQHD